MRQLFTYFSLIIFLLFFSCGFPSNDPIVMDWIAMNDINKNLMEDITVFSGINNGVPIKAWYVDIDLTSSKVAVDIAVSADNDLRTTPSEFLDSLGATIVINGGYFLMHENPTKHIGLLKMRRNLVSSVVNRVGRNGLKYYVSRGAFGIFDDNLVDIAWISSKSDTIFEWHNPIPNIPNKPVDYVDYANTSVWNPVSALQAGPVLITDSEINVTSIEEVFFGTSIVKTHPRTAIGYTSDNHLIIMVVDGRQATSRGVSLEELAQMMKQLNCYEALNLDGGGSSAIIVNGKLLNRPAGKRDQREVMSAIMVYES
ncbi:phosphodiester glycosidase family protein [Candidatus Neomarinimicrobiota bacterium]